jgi:Undecaprenyl-phosphate galactose phosphotransferase WbaP
MMESAVRHFSVEQLRLLGKVKDVPFLGISVYRLLMSAALLASDAFALLLSGWSAIMIRTFMGQHPALSFLPLSPYFEPSVYQRFIPGFLVFLMVYATRRLYPAIGINRVDEVRLLTISTSLVSALFATILFLLQRGSLYSRLAFALFWAAAILLVPIGRVMIRKLLVRLSLWGVPVGVVGSGPKTSRTISFLENHPNLGFQPRFVFDGSERDQRKGDQISDIDVQSLEHASPKPILEKVDTLVVVQNETAEHLIDTLVSEINGRLPRIVMMPDLPAVGSIWVRPMDLGGVLALKIYNNLANPWERILKRTLDLFLGSFLTLAALPIMLLIAVAIKLDSRGPLFYGHKRIGADGRVFMCWKFRTMVQDADQILHDYLNRHPAQKREWEVSQKLKRDPRITRVGRLLRKFSLDELPQLWNVFKGEMSLVGPRPIVDAETSHYKEALRLYESVRPGITGLWQVSGRNDVGYNTRVELDSYYVRNWSVWMDLYILARTPIAVFSRDGAY